MPLTTLYLHDYLIDGTAALPEGLTPESAEALLRRYYDDIYDPQYPNADEKESFSAWMSQFEGRIQPEADGSREPEWYPQFALVIDTDVRDAEGRPALVTGIKYELYHDQSDDTEQRHAVGLASYVTKNPAYTPTNIAADTLAAHPEILQEGEEAAPFDMDAFKQAIRESNGAPTIEYHGHTIALARPYYPTSRLLDDCAEDLKSIAASFDPAHRYMGMVWELDRVSREARWDKDESSMPPLQRFDIVTDSTLGTHSPDADYGYGFLPLFREHIQFPLSSEHPHFRLDLLWRTPDGTMELTPESIDALQRFTESYAYACYWTVFEEDPHYAELGDAAIEEATDRAVEIDPVLPLVLAQLDALKAHIEQQQGQTIAPRDLDDLIALDEAMHVIFNQTPGNDIIAANAQALFEMEAQDETRETPLSAEALLERLETLHAQQQDVTTEAVVVEIGAPTAHEPERHPLGTFADWAGARVANAYAAEAVAFEAQNADLVAEQSNLFTRAIHAIFHR